MSSINHLHPSYEACDMPTKSIPTIPIESIQTQQKVNTKSNIKPDTSFSHFIIGLGWITYYTCCGFPIKTLWTGAFCRQLDTSLAWIGMQGRKFEWTSGCIWPLLTSRAGPLDIVDHTHFITLQIQHKNGLLQSCSVQQNLQQNIIDTGLLIFFLHKIVKTWNNYSWTFQCMWQTTKKLHYVWHSGFCFSLCVSWCSFRYKTLCWGFILSISLNKTIKHTFNILLGWLVVRPHTRSILLSI